MVYGGLAKNYKEFWQKYGWFIRKQLREMAEEDKQAKKPVELFDTAVKEAKKHG